MRAGLMLEGLAQRFDVYLFVVPVAGGSVEVPDFIRELTIRVSVASLRDVIDPLADLIDRIDDAAERRSQISGYSLPWAARFSKMASAQLAIALVEDIRVDMLYVMRLYMAPLGAQILRLMKPMSPVALLDLDEDDAQVHERIAGLRELRGDAVAAQADRVQAAKYETCAAVVLPKFSAILVSSKDEARRFSTRHTRVRIEAVANGYVPAPFRAGKICMYGRNAQPLRLLFVANLGYFPNEDAADQLIRAVVPEIRQRGTDVHLDVVGPTSSADIFRNEIEKGSYVAIHGKVDNLRDWYAQADIAVMPLRAGGGTRIKILEAFSYGVPVVSSSIGAEGIDAENGKHLLCADSAIDFASACLRLAADRALAAALVANAKELLFLNYTPERVHAKLDSIIDSLPFEG